MKNEKIKQSLHLLLLLFIKRLMNELKVLVKKKNHKNFKFQIIIIKNRFAFIFFHYFLLRSKSTEIQLINC